MCCFLWFKFVGLNSVLQQNDDISVSVNIFKLISPEISILKNKSKCFLKARVHCRVMKTKGMVFRYTWVYSKEDTMAHTRMPVVTS